MEQTPSLPSRGPELPSVAPRSNGETIEDRSGHEVSTGGAVERQEQRVETAPAAEQAAAPPVMPTVPVVASPLADDSTASQPAQITLPTVANDDDLIEKEWVDKAKKVLAETKDDPYRREQEVNRLQADYLLKRYGRELGSS